MRKKRWRNRKGAGLLALALALGLALSGTGALESRAAIAVDVDEKGTLTVDTADLYHLEGLVYQNGMAVGTDEKDLSEMQSEVVINLYQVASMDASGKYRLIHGFEEVKSLSEGISGISDETSAMEWSNFAAAARDVVVDDEGDWITDGQKVSAFVEQKRTTSENYSVIFENLAVGLYLVGAEQVVTDNYVYDFTPYLVSVPNNRFYGTGDDSWIYNVEMGLKAEQTPRYGNLQIQKVVESLSAMPGSAATFVYQLDIKTPKGEQEQRIEAVTINKGGTEYATVTKIPAGSTVRVSEIYSGAGYEQVSDPSPETVQIIANDDYVSEGETAKVASVSFVNAPDGTTTGGYGIRNNFRLEGVQYQWNQNHSGTDSVTE